MRYGWSFGTLLSLIIIGVLLSMLVWLIERNYHEDSGESHLFLFGSLTGVLGMIGGMIGLATGGMGSAIGYYYAFALIGGYLVSGCLFDYDFSRRIILCLLSPVVIALSLVAGNNFDQWFGQILAK